MFQKNFTEIGNKKNINEIDDKEIILDVGPKTLDDLVKKSKAQKQFYGTALLVILKTIFLLKEQIQLQKNIISYHSR